MCHGQEYFSPALELHDFEAVIAISISRHWINWCRKLSCIEWHNLRMLQLCSTVVHYVINDTDVSLAVSFQISNFPCYHSPVSFYLYKYSIMAGFNKQQVSSTRGTTLFFQGVILVSCDFADNGGSYKTDSSSHTVLTTTSTNIGKKQQPP